MHADASLSARPKRRLAITGIVIGSLLTLSPLVGVIGAAVGMVGAFDVLGRSGIADPRALSTQISQVLSATATGLFLFPVGLVVLTVSIVFYTRRRPPAPPPLPLPDGR